MQDPAAHLDVVGGIVSALTELGLTPIMIGGMALVTIGSRRVPRLQRIARGARSVPGDIEDIRFLQARRRRSRQL